MRLTAAAFVSLALAVGAAASRDTAAGSTLAQSAVGEQRVLVLLATWGPQPWPREEVASAFEEADRFMRRSSFDQLRLLGDVTPWLAGFSARPPCPSFTPGDGVPEALTSGPDAAAAAAGYRIESYDRVIYVVPRIPCDWDGVGIRRQIVLNESRNVVDIVHELGHTYGLSHARAQACRDCPVQEQGDSFSPMGRGLADFSAFEKVALGWIGEVARVSRPGSHAIGRPDVRSATPHALVLPTRTGEYWFEQRVDRGRLELLVRRILPDVSAELGPPTLFVGAVARGGTFRVGGDFSLRYGETVRFDWLDDHTAPSAPRVAVRANRISWAARDAGSGIASCTITLDGRTIARGAATGGVALPTVKAGSHRVSVACVDRAGNKGRATAKRIRVR